MKNVVIVCSFLGLCFPCFADDCPNEISNRIFNGYNSGFQSSPPVFFVPTRPVMMQPTIFPGQGSTLIVNKTVNYYGAGAEESADVGQYQVSHADNAEMQYKMELVKAGAGLTGAMLERSKSGGSDPLTQLVSLPFDIIGGIFGMFTAR